MTKELKPQNQSLTHYKDEPFKLSYSSSKIPLMPPLLSIFVGIMILMYLNSKFDFSFNVYALCWLIVWFFGNLVCHSVFRYRHSVVFSKNGILLKDGKLEQNIPWKNVKRTKWMDDRWKDDGLKNDRFMSLKIETIDESSQVKIYYLPLDLLFSFEKESEYKEIVDIVLKNTSGDLSDREYRLLKQEEDNTNIISYTLQRKKEVPFLLVLALIIIGFFFVFNMELALAIAFLYAFIFYIYSTEGKDDLVFDKTGITVYHKRNITYIPWYDVFDISFNFKSKEKTLSVRYNGGTLTWKFRTSGNVHGDEYDFFRKVSELRGKAAIDWKSEV